MTRHLPDLAFLLGLAVAALGVGLTAEFLLGPLAALGAGVMAAGVALIVAGVIYAQAADE